MELWLVFVPIAFCVIFVSSCMEMDRITNVMENVYRGKSVEEQEIAMISGLVLSDLCKPLTEETLQRMHACTQVKRAKVKTDLRHPLKLLVSVCELDVTYDFEGTEPDGQTLTISESARVRVYYEKSRYSHVMVIRRVELVERKE